MSFSSPVPDPETSPTYPRIEFEHLFHSSEWEKTIPWKSFRPGIEIHRLYGDGVQGPSTALLRYQPGTGVSLHMHQGYEHVLILAGSQEDQNGRRGPGSLIINPPGSTHKIVSDQGCIVLVIYEKPVEFRQDVKQHSPSVS